MTNSIKILKSFLPVDFTTALNFMHLKVKELSKNNELGYLWFLEHPSIYTAGLTANENDLINSNNIPVYNTDRGGKYTYHGPGQKIIYVLLNLKILQDEKPDIKKFIYNLEEVVILMLKDININCFRIEGKIGVWTSIDNIPHKIAAIGLRIKNWITYHGVSININPDLEHFKGIVPCGIKDCKVTSTNNIIGEINDKLFEDLFYKHFSTIFNINLNSEYEFK